MKKINLLPPYKVNMAIGTLTADNYNIAMINVPSQWKRTRGKNVKVAVFDTGEPQHTDIPCGKARYNYSTDWWGYDANGHATHVAGIINSCSCGIAPEVDVYYYKVLERTGQGDMSSIASAIRHAVDVNGINVINMSLGTRYHAGGVRYRVLEEACNYAARNGTVIVCAAGNDNYRLGEPAMYDSVISVAAVDKNMRRADFSNWGREVDFAAGGVNVFSTFLNNSYAMLSGTSMACPAIAGVIALIMSEEYEKSGKYLSFGEVYQRIKSIAYDVGVDGFDDKYGWGIPIFNNQRYNENGRVYRGGAWYRFVTWLRYLL